MAVSDCGYYSYLSGKTARFLAHQERRGMSDGALARLPKRPHLPEPIILQPVLATKRHAINVTVQAAQIKARDRKRAQFFPRATAEVPPFRRDPNKGARLQRANAIIEIVAKEAGIEGWQMRNWRDQPRKSNRVALARNIAIHLIMSLVGVPGCVAADLFDFHDVAMPRWLAARVRRDMKSGHRAANALHDRAMTAIKARWPEYAR